MTFQGDPYRTLGLAPGASVNEIRSAYRRLAKRYHPDAAGERALPRFLSIQAAYEALVDANGDLRRAGPAGGATPATGAGGAGGAGAPWHADASRARASRDAWRARGRSASPGSDGASPPPRDDQGDPAGAKPGTGDRRRPGANAEHHHRRHRRAATPGSTTYDEAAEAPLDPAWDGGTWYGASSGTYWTLNPREYADPRKHGPEYRRRAWRAAGHRAPGPSAPPLHAEAAEPSRAAPRPPSGTTGSAPEQPSGSSASGYSTEDRPASAPIPDTTPLAGLLPEGLLARAHGGARGRALVAIVATAPAPWLATIILTGLAGCSTGGCPPSVPAIAVLAWAVAALLAAALPAASALGAFAVLVAAAGTLASGTILALASGDPVRGVAQAAGTLGIVLYCFALVIGGARLYGRREVDSPEA